jgi:hypothetical protein
MSSSLEGKKVGVVVTASSAWPVEHPAFPIPTRRDYPSDRAGHALPSKIFDFGMVQAADVRDGFGQDVKTFHVRVLLPTIEHSFFLLGTKRPFL